MTFLLRQLFNLIYLLNSETGTNSISAGFCCGLVLGFSPIYSLQSLLVVLILLIFRVQLGAALVAMAFFKLMALPMVGLFHVIGDFVLSISMLEPVFVYFYNLPLIPMTRFYNTVVMGAGILSVVLIPPFFYLSKFLIDQYRRTVVRRLKETKVWTVWQASTIYKWYQRYKSIYG